MERIKEHTSKETAQLLFSIAEKFHIQDIVFSPGSRNAPLVIEHFNYPFRSRVIVDERSAAFTALGMAQQTRKPVMLVCTSGSAVLNYYPAVAEAFYAKVPLIVISADRPPYRIDKGEGQTIRQKGVLKNHIHFEADLDLDIQPDTTKMLIKAFTTAIEKKGPVHINIPFDEPLYETVDKKISLDIPPYEPPSQRPVEEKLINQAETIWKKAEKKLFIVGQNQYDDFLLKQLERLAQFDDTVILTENISNFSSPAFFSHIDRLIFPFDSEDWRHYAPDLVVTIGNNIISKKIKYLLRDFKPSFGHWHIGKENIPPDTFDCLKLHINHNPVMFFSQFLFRIYDFNPQSDYRKLWQDLNARRQEKHDNFLMLSPGGDLLFYHTLSKVIEPPYQIQWGNSTVVRYAQLFDYHPEIKHFSNRGTSGIDGTVSTAVGAALRTNMPVLLITGDLAFHYDLNALWQEFPGNLKIIVINNGGGDIFRFIPGPDTIPDYEQFFVKKSFETYEKIAEFYDLKYHYLNLNNKDAKGFADVLQNFLRNNTQLMEIDTSQIPNAEILRKYFDNLK